MFDSDFLKKLEYLSLVSRRVFRGRVLAQRRSQRHGGGVEFADHRDYTYGDDLRYLDWNLFARLGNRLIKRFAEEEDLHIYFLLDCSRSMATGTPSKFDYARQVVAALAYIALADLDRVAVVALDDQVRGIFPPMRGKQHFVSLLRFLEGCVIGNAETDLKAAVGGFLHRRMRPGLAVIVSDFYDPQGFESALDTLRHHGFEPDVIQLHTPAEAMPPLRGDLLLTDAETGTTREVTLSESVLAAYRSRFIDFLASLRAYCTAKGFGCTIASVDTSFEELVLRMMREAGTVA